MKNLISHDRQPEENHRHTGGCRYPGWRNVIERMRWLPGQVRSDEMQSSDEL